MFGRCAARGTGGLSVVIEEEKEERHLGDGREIWLSNIAFVYSDMKEENGLIPLFNNLCKLNKTKYC